ncbi:DgyrCDS10277 [Dimorphilus gyrociliatus]|uniref:DgyrCDS10277 n=1 Tax=Dimorphilus gyrociliatus TaxID=2664684 RepID=A0A7I8W4U4_9ANNE|nr:DgyrCDS10277 [Dimorphilus gyrociliatus]
MKLAVVAFLLIAVTIYVTADESPAEEKRRGWGKRSWGKRSDDEDRFDALEEKRRSWGKRAMGWGKRAMGWGKRGSEEEACERLQQNAMFYTFKAIELENQRQKMCA